MGLKNQSNVSFIIVNYNSSDYIRSLIESKQNSVLSLKDEVLIIDNSAQAEIKELTRDFKDIKLYVMHENVGFSKANNFASEKSEGEYLVFVNPDVLFTEDCINPIVEFIEKNKNAGACAPMLLNEDLSFQNSAGFRMGLLFEFAEAFFLIDLFRVLYRLKFRSYIKNKIPCSVSWLSAALFVIKKSVYEDIGGFDSAFFLNYEDIDLCRRLQKKGYNNYYFPYLNSIHISHHSFKKDYDSLVYSRYVSRRIYAKKHYNNFTCFLVSVMHIAGLLIRISTVCFFYQGREKKQRFSGYKRSLRLYFEW